jgi:hypothetical protein
MSTTRQTSDPEPGSVDVTAYDAVSKGEQLLERVRVVAQRIAERVRRATADTVAETSSLAQPNPDSPPRAPDQSPQQA